MGMVQRTDARGAEELRPITIEPDIQPGAYASLLISCGGTAIICAVSLEVGVPRFLEDSGQGWITAEYAMLPGATNSRSRREINGRSGRSMEIQRLIGRSLRMMVDLKDLQEHTLRVDCDVLRADGGTRTASITGGALAVRRAITRMVAEQRLKKMIEINPVAAVSVGLVDGEILLDLDYSEDSRADADGNFVMTRSGHWVEVQVTAEQQPLEPGQVDELQKRAKAGIQQLFRLWDHDGDGAG